MTTLELHPIARDTLELFAAQSYFRSFRMGVALAERDPAHCLRWALELLEPIVGASPPQDLIAWTFAAVREAIAGRFANDLSQLDEISWQLWISNAFDESAPFGPRSVARLGWATILLTCEKLNLYFKSEHTGTNEIGMLREMANQCSMAVDMMCTDTSEGRLMVAAAFSREMAPES